MHVTPFPFREEQRFIRYWWWLLLLILLPAPYVLFILPFQDDPHSEPFILLTIVPAFVVSFLLLILLFLAIRLETEITMEHIAYRYFPFHWKTRVVKWDQLAEIYVREYRPLKEYGGWGIRFRQLDFRDILLNVSGKTGIQLVFKDGKRILIGTLKGEEVAELLKRIHLLQYKN